MQDKVPFNKPYLCGKEFEYMHDACKRGQTAGDGFYTESCHKWLEDYVGSKKALLTHFP